MASLHVNTYRATTSFSSPVSGVVGEEATEAGRGQLAQGLVVHLDFILRAMRAIGGI